MKITVKMNKNFLKENREIAERCLVKTADALKTDLIQSQTMPFGESKQWIDREGNSRNYMGGTLQNRSTFVDKKSRGELKVRIISDTPYARRLYFHPEYNFYKGENPNAGGKWFQPYIDGNKKDFAAKTFAKFLERSRR